MHQPAWLPGLIPGLPIPSRPAPPSSSPVSPRVKSPPVCFHLVLFFPPFPVILSLVS